MTAYAAPISDMRFVLRHLVGLDRIAALPGKSETTPELVEAVLEEAGRLAAEVIAPLNATGDREGARLENGVVRTAPGFREAYARYRDGGWNALPFEAEWGGQDLPWAVAMAVSEMWQSASLAFGLCPVLNQGAVEALQAHGSDEQKRTYLPKLVSGVWTGTMNLTEPQAGSDVGAVRTRAERQADGSYRITGQKIFITYGDHDMAENIVHLVLARTPDAPAGIKGISLFLVPKLLPDADGNPGERNDLRCVSLEHKLGIHASPTCVMAYGDAGGATGFLIGQENRGIEYMFTMMNNARLTVGLQGVAIAERATQAAEAYAATRVQGKPIGSDASAPIAAHPDVRRMLLSMRSLTEAARALTYSAGAALDLARGHPDPAERAKAQARVDLLTPVVKGWSTDVGCEVASTGIQVHGGMGYIEETGAAQFLRDARITPIYEGTNGIQANDLAFRKVARDGGAAALALFEEMAQTIVDLPSAPFPSAVLIRDRLGGSLAALMAATDWVVETAPGNPAAVAASAVHYLRMFGLVAGGWLTARAALAALSDDSGPEFRAAKLAQARFFAEQFLPQATCLLLPITDGWHSVVE
ncbi:acyl-CoA dehydrogenase [Mycobacterium sp. KBS0706]|uniref:acyl-CoA dehydrogenase n=1 Tax=Mycobacterium sp. KBS0706 TaxID=2578109 RepID=UPI00110FB9E0|nr:acyl-CoA dehydrogenase [Mycobacterium sp. KBS0706]TSD88650.1 acyl-CoA dehydrogenase [Mycobacterium sp. KBS0706]